MKKTIIAAVAVFTSAAAVIFAVTEFLMRFAVYRKRDSGDTQETVIRGSDPEPIKERKRAAFSYDYEWAEIESYDGLKLRARIFNAPEKSKRTAILFHGFRANGMIEFSPFVKYYHEHGYNVIMVEMRAHGHSEGKYLGFGVLDRYDCLSWCNYAVSRWGRECRLYLHGVSMGCATILMATGLQLPHNVRAIIADCGYTTPYVQFAHTLNNYFHLPARLLLFIANLRCGITAGWRFCDASTLDCVKETSIPIMFVHGKADTFIPPQCSIDNYNACASEKELFLVEGAAHAMSFYTATEEYERRMTAFLADK